MRRALWGQLGSDWLRRYEGDEAGLEILRGEGEGVNGLLFGARDWRAVETFRFLRFMLGDFWGTAGASYARMLEDNLTHRDAIRTAQGRATDLDLAAIMSSGMSSSDIHSRSRSARRADWTRADDFFTVFEDAGPHRSGMLIEMVGVMGSGKSNTLAWIAGQALERGFHVFADFPYRPATENFHEVYSQSDLVLELVAFARGKPDPEHPEKGNVPPDRPGFVLIDEAGGRGGSSVTAMTLEARWAMQFLTKTRKFSVNSIRARQVDKLPDDQRRVVTGVIEKKPETRELMAIKWLQGAGAGLTDDRMSIPDCGTHYPTTAQTSLSWDLDTDELDRHLSRTRGKGGSLKEIVANELDEVEKFVKAYQMGDSPDGGREDAPSVDAPFDLPPELAKKPEGGWPVICTHPGCGHEWTYDGGQLPIPGARIDHGRHKILFRKAIVARGLLDRKRGDAATADTAPRPADTTP